MKDIKLNLNTHDLDLSNFQLEFVEGLDYYRQKVTVVLKFFYGEWFLDTTLGIKYFEEIFVKNPNFTLIDNLFKIAILEIDGIIELIAYDSVYDRQNRKLTITFTVQTDAGQLSDSQEVTI